MSFNEEANEVEHFIFVQVWSQARMDSALSNMRSELCQHELSQVPECQSQP